MGLAFSVAPHMADAFLDDDVPVVMARPRDPPIWRQSPLFPGTRGVGRGPARASLSV